MAQDVIIVDVVFVKGQGLIRGIRDRWSMHVEARADWRRIASGGSQRVCAGAWVWERQLPESCYVFDCRCLVPLGSPEAILIEMLLVLEHLHQVLLFSDGFLAFQRLLPVY